MKKSLFILSSFLMISSAVFAQKIHRNDTIFDYKPERGYFQKAYVDASDPRFMITNENETFAFGVGGAIAFNPYFDFYGATANTEFSPYNIIVPTDYSRHFGFSIQGTNLYVKTRIKLGKHNMIGVFKIEGNLENYVKIDQVYLSYFGFTVGRTYSLFRDLAMGIQVVDTKGICSEVCGTRLQIAYLHEFNKNWEVGLSFEKPEFSMPQPSKIYNDYDIYKFADRSSRFELVKEFQSMPNIVARATYKGRHGHVQVAGLFRKMHYFSSDNGIDVGDFGCEGSNKYLYGYGVSLSGKYIFNKNLFITGQVMGGSGVTSYIKDIDSKGLDTYIADDVFDENTQQFTTKSNKLKAHQSISALLGVQYNWSPKLTSAFAIGGVVIDKNDPLQLYNSTGYAALNLFWNINPYLRLGGEFVGGYRLNAFEFKEGDGKIGQALRFNAKVSYMF